MAEDRRDRYRLLHRHRLSRRLQAPGPIPDPARFDWNEATKVAHYYLSVNALTRPMQVREEPGRYGGQDEP